MKSPALLCLLGIASCVLAACGMGETSEAGEGADVAGEGLRTCVVDPQEGNDTAAPSGQFCGITRTLSYQLAELARIGASGVDVIVREGTYTASMEQFPLVIPPGVRLRGDDAPGAGPVIFDGAGTYTSQAGALYQATMVLRGTARVRNVHLLSRATALILDDTKQGSIVQNVDIERCERGLVALQDSSSVIGALRVAGCTVAGIETRDRSRPTFARSSVTSSGVGVLIEDDSEPRFGGNGAGSNTFALNTLCDFRSRSTATLNAVDNVWDDDVFSFFPQLQCTAGENLVVEGLGNVLYQYLPHQNEPLFQATAPIALLEPEYGAFLSTTQPTFIWSVSSRTNKMALAVWDTQPDVGLHGIENAEHIVLFWHSGMQTGSPGVVAFSDAARPVGQDIEQLEPPQPLQGGRPYYWAVWEWDDRGLQIEYSSEIRVFTVRP